MPVRHPISRFRTTISSVLLLALGTLTACGGSDEAPAPSTAEVATPLSCDDGIKTAFKPDAATSVLLVKLFKQGDPLILSGTATASTPTAGAETCLVKLLVGPGNPGPADAPSTSAGIGIEVWLPSASSWNERIRIYGNGGYAGSDETSLTKIGAGGSGSPIPVKAAAVAKGFVVATSDNGHVAKGGGSFLMNPDGTINTVLWQDFAERSLRQLAAKTKLLAKAYYAKPHKYAYWDGFSTGGRQGMKMAQVNAEEFDGILVGAPVINWSRFLTGDLYPHIVMRRDLGGNISTGKLDAVTARAVSTCGGATLGFLIDPFSCRYDPTTDAAALCSGVAGNGGVVGSAGAPNCVNLAEATSINKIWYGQTADGTVPDPATDNGSGPFLGSSNQLWFGLTRGASLTTQAGPTPFSIAVDTVALELQDPRLADATFINAVSNGLGRWTALTYGGLTNALYQGILLQPQFSNIDTDNPDLSAFNARKGKLMHYHGLSDQIVPPSGSVNYYNRVLATMGGAAEVQKFYRFYLIPALTHTGAFTGGASQPLPQPASGRDEMFTALQNWVENGVAPDRINVTSPDASVSLPLCVYPKKITYGGAGAVTSAASYSCS